MIFGILLSTNKGAWRNGRRNGLKKLSFVEVYSKKVSSQIQGSLSLILNMITLSQDLFILDKVQRLDGNYLSFR